MTHFVTLLVTSVIRPGLMLHIHPTFNSGSSRFGFSSSCFAHAICQNGTSSVHWLTNLNNGTKWLIGCIQRLRDGQPKEILKSRDYVLCYENETAIRNIKIDRQFFDQINLDPGGVIVTAIGDNCDFISRFFTKIRRLFV